MRIKKILTVLSLAALLQSCETTECCVIINGDNVAGEYLVFEYGYSPGDKYIVEHVASEPAQLLNFGENGEFSSNYAGLTVFSSYKVYEDPNEGPVVALFEQDPPETNDTSVQSLTHSYMMEIDGVEMKLYFRYCIEGCHIGLRRIK